MFFFIVEGTRPQILRRQLLCFPPFLCLFVERFLLGFPLKLRHPGNHSVCATPNFPPIPIMTRRAEENKSYFVSISLITCKCCLRLLEMRGESTQNGSGRVKMILLFRRNENRWLSICCSSKQTRRDLNCVHLPSRRNRRAGKMSE